MILEGSYSRQIRSELCRLPIRPGRCALAEWWGLSGYWPDPPQDPPDALLVSSALVARRAFRLLRTLELDPVMEVRHARQKIGFHLRAASPASPPPARQVLEDCPAGWIRGAFLRHGYMTPPGRASHLEFWTVWPHEAAAVQSALSQMGLKSGVFPRRGGVTVYVQGRNQLVTLLAAIGAHAAVLQVENIRAMKSMKNRINRLVNSETANLVRTVESGMEQARLCQRLKGSPLWESLPDSLRQVAISRLGHPDWSLREIGRALKPPLSKSAVNHRMRKLTALAERL